MKRKEAIEFLDKVTDVLDCLAVVSKSKQFKGTPLEDDRVLNIIVKSYEAGLVDAMCLLEYDEDYDPKDYVLRKLSTLFDLLGDHERKHADD